MDGLSNGIQLEMIVGEQELNQGNHSEDAVVNVAICSEICAEVKIYMLKLPP